MHIYWGKKCIRDWAEPGCTPWGGCQPTDVVGGSRWQVSKCRGRRRPLTWWTWPRTYGPATMAWVKLSVLCLGRSPAELAARPRVGRCSSNVQFTVRLAARAVQHAVLHAAEQEGCNESHHRDSHCPHGRTALRTRLRDGHASHAHQMAHWWVLGGWKRVLARKKPLDVWARVAGMCTRARRHVHCGCGGFARHPYCPTACRRSLCQATNTYPGTLIARHARICFAR